MDKEQANARLMYYYEFLFKFLNEGVKPIELLEDIEATAWEYAYQKMGRPEDKTSRLYMKKYNDDFSKIFAETWKDLKSIKEDLE